MSTSRSLCLPSIILLFLLSVPHLLAQRPVAYYPLNGDANDASGNGLNGVVNGAVPTTDRFGNPGGALAFTAAESDHIVIRSCGGLSFGTHDFTVAAWVKFCGEQVEYAGIVCKGPPNNSYPGYQLHIASGDKFTTQIGDEGNWADERRGRQALSDGRWHLLAVAVSPGNNTIVQYVDGVQVSSYQEVYTQRGPLNVSRYDPTPLYIGTERNFDRFFDGTIDDVRLYDQVLNERQMQALYSENGWTGVEAPPSGPVAYYPFNGDANDASGNDLNGVVNGPVPTFDRFGHCNSAYAFNGTERDHIVVPHNRLLAFGRHDFTAVSWIKFCGEEPEYAGIVCKGPPNNSYPGYQLHIASGDKFTTQIGDNGNWGDERRGRQALSDGRWHMVAVSVSPCTNTVILYVDGQPVDEYEQHYTRRGGLNVSRFDPTPLLIGTERNTDRFFTGVIDDVRLYDRLLSKCEMESLYRENGWTGESRLPEPGITITGPSSIRDGERTRLSVDCYPDVRWSTGEMGSSITVDHPGVYTATVSDGSGCGTQTATVTIGSAPCGDSLLYSLVLPWRCVGSSERVTFPIPNPGREPIVITRVEFLNGGEYVEFTEPLPIVIPPGGRELVTVGYRWLTEGAQNTRIRIVAGNGRAYLVEIKSRGLFAFGPIFNTSDIRFTHCSGRADTCITVTNTTSMIVTFTSAAWLYPGSEFQLISPALPFVVRPGESIQICVRYQGREVGDANVLILGGEGTDRYGETNDCIVQRFNVRVGGYIGRGGVDHTGGYPGSGSAGSGSHGSTDSTGSGSGSNGSGSHGSTDSTGSGSGSNGSGSHGSTDSTGSGSGSHGSGSHGSTDSTGSGSHGSGASGSHPGRDSTGLSGTDDYLSILSTGSLRLYPNPADREVSATFTTSGFGRATLELFNAAGEKVRVKFEENLEAGSHIVRLATDDLTSGVYILRLTYGDVVRTSSVIIRR